MPDYRIGSMTVPGDFPGKSRIVYFAKLPFGGEATGDLQNVIGAIEFEYASNEAMKAHIGKLEIWAEAFAQRAKDWQRAHIDMTDQFFRSACILDTLFDTVVESYDLEEEFATEVAPAAAALNRR